MAAERATFRSVMRSFFTLLEIGFQLAGNFTGNCYAIFRFSSSHMTT